MESENLICNSNNITYSKGYIALWLNNYTTPDTLDVGGDTLLKQDHFHVSILCVKNILENHPDIEQDIIDHFCDFTKANELKFAGFTREFRFANDAERKSVVALCKVSNLDAFTDYLSEKIGVKIAHHPAHVTIYTLQSNAGIGLNSREEMELKSKPMKVPEAVLATLVHKTGAIN